MTIKRKNHVVTRGYLTGWKFIDGQQKVGIWYFDVASRSVMFSEGLKASFAISKDLYSPVYINGLRDDRFENWLAESEGDLCEFARSFSGKRVPHLKRRATERALASIVSAGYRSELSVRAVESQIQLQDPLLSAEQVRLRALNNIYAGAQDRISFFRTGTIVILRNVQNPLRTNDQPFWDMTPRDETFPLGVFALSPTCLMAFSPSIAPAVGNLEIIVKDAAGHESMVEFARLAAMRMARTWVVCANKADAEEVANYLTPQVIEEVKATDKVRVLTMNEIRGLFSV